MPVDADEVTISSVQAAAIIGISAAQLHRLRKAGTVPFIQTPGSHPRYRRAVIEAFADKYTHQEKAAAQ